MPEQPIFTQIDGRELKLSNPTKLLYPEKEITKAEVIQYYLQVADLLLTHISDRPLTVIRFPDGVDGNRFYSKNKPNWTPDWVASTHYEEDNENQYVLATEKATLVWLANLAALELHPMNVRVPNAKFPDQFIYDLDPSEQFDFEELKEIALELKVFLESFGYRSFLKTSGSKGLHIYIPIKPIYSKKDVFSAFEKITKQFVQQHKDKTTLTITKEKREGKVFIDILRNKSSNSCVAPYSLRGKSGAPVSMPILWEELEDITSSKHYDIRLALKTIESRGDAWKDIWACAAALHTKSTSASKELESYNQKRDFTKTAEPTEAQTIQTSGRDYCVQLHDATNLHYDLRLEENGVLLSWAIPKGLPHEKGIKRLAIETEPHPLKYLDFEGTIPKGEYGGGTMFVFDRGQYKVIKREKKKIHFQLEQGGLEGEYLLYKTKGKQWLIEKKSEDHHFDLKEFKEPMLASMGESIPKENHFFEIKWDGLRATFLIEQGKLTIFSKSGNDITTQFPELQIMTKQIEAEKAIIDGEIVNLDQLGRPQFANIVGRIHTVGDRSIELAAKKNPATAYLFDLLYLDGKDCRQETNVKRRQWLKTILSAGDTVRYSESFEDGEMLFQAIKQQGMEGIICKQNEGTYLSNARSPYWSKIKVRHDAEAFIIGYTKGEGDRSNLIGALHLAIKNKDGNLQYMGKVGTGFTIDMLIAIQKELNQVPVIEKPISDAIEKESQTTWLAPEYICEINYASLTSNGTYREPVYQRMRKVNT